MGIAVVDRNACDSCGVVFPAARCPFCGSTDLRFVDSIRTFAEDSDSTEDGTTAMLRIRGLESRLSEVVEAIGEFPQTPCAARQQWLRNLARWSRSNKTKSEITDLSIPNRRQLPALVVTATDWKFFRGAYAMIWSLLRQHEVSVIVYDLGIDRDSPMVRQMESWGVEFRQIPISPADTTIKGWQTWNKPVYALDAMGQHERIIWLDADTTVGGDLTPMLTEPLFIADHGTFRPVLNPNRPEFHERFGPPRRTWGDQYPCAGVFSCDWTQEALLREWLDRVKFVIGNESLRRSCKFYDQNCLQDLVDCDLQDGKIWNNFQVRRTGTEQDILAQTYNYQHVISHFGGKKKPWFRWPQQIDWGKPF